MVDGGYGLITPKCFRYSMKTNRTDRFLSDMAEPSESEENGGTTLFYVLGKRSPNRQH